MATKIIQQVQIDLPMTLLADMLRAGCRLWCDGVGVQKVLPQIGCAISEKDWPKLLAVTDEYVVESATRNDYERIDFGDEWQKIVRYADTAVWEFLQRIGGHGCINIEEGLPPRFAKVITSSKKEG